MFSFETKKKFCVKKIKKKVSPLLTKNVQPQEPHLCLAKPNKNLWFRQFSNFKFEKIQFKPQTVFIREISPTKTQEERERDEKEFKSVLYQ